MKSELFDDGITDISPQCQQLLGRVFTNSSAHPCSYKIRCHTWLMGSVCCSKTMLADMVVDCSGHSCDKYVVAGYRANSMHSAVR